MLKVLICERWSVGADGHAVRAQPAVVHRPRRSMREAYCASNEFGV